MPDDVFAAPEAPRPINRFCTMCGASWQPDWVVCGACLPIDKAGDAAHRQPVTSIRLPILLYFAMLLTTLIGMGLPIFQAASRVDQYLGQRLL